MLTVVFIDEEIEVPEVLTFGRTADLSIDDSNTYMHRVVGSFDKRGDTWWLTNCGSSIRLRLTDSNALRADLPAGSTTALTGDSGVISFEAGPATYELEYRLPGVAAPMSSAPPSDSTDHVDTAAIGTEQFGIALTPRETDFMCEFCRPALLGTGTAPTYADVAAKYEVSEKTVDNTLQTLRRKLKESGVRGVTTLDALVEHLISTGKITLDLVNERS
jgi:hypothetical protein